MKTHESSIYRYTHSKIPYLILAGYWGGGEQDMICLGTISSGYI